MPWQVMECEGGTGRNSKRFYTWVTGENDGIIMEVEG